MRTRVGGVRGMAPPSPTAQGGAKAGTRTQKETGTVEPTSLAERPKRAELACTARDSQCTLPDRQSKAFLAVEAYPQDGETDDGLGRTSTCPTWQKVPEYRPRLSAWGLLADAIDACLQANRLENSNAPQRRYCACCVERKRLCTR